MNLFYRPVKVFAVIIISLLIFQQKTYTQNNPLFYKFNRTMDFSRVTAKNVDEFTAASIKNCNAILEKIYSVPKDKRTFDNTMLAFDNCFDKFMNAYNIIGLFVNVHPDSAVRRVSNEASVELDKFSNQLFLDEKLYQAIKDYSKTKEALALTGSKAKLVKDLVDKFERSGFKLSPEKRQELKAIQDKLSEISIAFATNIADYQDSLIVTDKEMEGLPQDYKDTYKVSDGKYKINLTYPSYQPFMKYSLSDSARKMLMMKFLNAAADKNLPLLKEALIYRNKMAALLGYKTYAEYRVADRMSKTPKAVWDFENSLLEKVKNKSLNDYQELIDIKRTYLKDNSVNVVEPWELPFYKNILLQKKYNLDQELVKQYFEVNNVISGLFRVAETLFDIKFKEVKNPKVWHPDVKLFEVFSNGRKIADFYFDLYPRENKFSHAATFEILRGKETPQGYQMPAVSLVCNFPKASQGHPALMPHSDVETIFHEFGHALHGMLVKAKLDYQSSFNVAWDFVETPSQAIENWAWNYDALKLFAKHYKTGEVLPQALYQNMLRAKNVSSGMNTAGQIELGMIDMTLHDGFDPEGSKTTTDVVREVAQKTLPYPFMEGTHFEARFGHLMGYDAGYYGYLWSKVFAQDIFSVFEKNGVMDKATGRRFRDMILSKGSTEDENKMLKDFLGREPDQHAFLRSIGVAEAN